MTAFIAKEDIPFGATASVGHHPLKPEFGGVLTSGIDGQAVEHAVKTYRHDIRIVYFQRIRIVDFCLIGKCAEYRLKKGVDGRHMELGVRQQQMTQRFGTHLGHSGSGGAKLLHEIFKIIGAGYCLGIGNVGIGKRGEFLHYALLHLACGFVGECDGQNF